VTTIENNSNDLTFNSSKKQTGLKLFSPLNNYTVKAGWDISSSSSSDNNIYSAVESHQGAGCHPSKSLWVVIKMEYEKLCGSL